MNHRWNPGDLAGSLAAGLLLILVILSVSAVALRYIVGNPLSWSEELSVLMLLWIIMIGAVYAKRKNAMLCMDIIYNLMPARLRGILDVVQELVHCTLFCLMIVYGYKLAVHVGSKTMPLLGLPVFWLYLSLPVGAAGLLIVSLLRLRNLLAGKREE